MYQIVTYTHEIADGLKVGVNDWEGIGPVDIDVRCFDDLQGAKPGLTTIRLSPVNPSGEVGPRWEVTTITYN